VNGRQYVVIATGGGRDPKAPSGGVYVAFAQNLHGALFQHAGPHTAFDVLARAAFQDNRLDSLEVQQVRERQARRPSADDSNLGANRGHEGISLSRN
jgi:hypothetical protein